MRPAALAAAPRRLKGQMRDRRAGPFLSRRPDRLAIPGEDDDVTVYSSTQHPSEVQHMVAHVLGVPAHAVTVEIRRMGGGFGGKETQGEPVRGGGGARGQEAQPRGEDPARPRRRHDRHRQAARFRGRLRGRLRRRGQHPRRRRHLCGALRLFGRSLRAGDRPGAVPLRQRLFLSGRAARSEPLYTNTVSNTAFRGFGGPQGMVGAERWIEDIAFALGKDPLEIRKPNFYGTRRPQCDALSPDGRGQHHPPHRR